MFKFSRGVPVKQLLATLALVARDGVGIAGMALISYGTWCIYPPAGYITLGALLVATSFLLARGE
jgi:hypothetical protein